MSLNMKGRAVVLTEPGVLWGASDKDATSPDLYFAPFGAINLRARGGKGDNSTDNASVIAAAIAALVARGGGALYIPAGIYRTSATLDFTGLAGKGISIFGDGASATFITCTTDNIAIVKLPGMHSIQMRGMRLQYLNQQASTNTDAIAIAGVDTSGTGFYNCFFENLFIDKAAIAVGATSGSPIWGNIFNSIYITNCTLNAFNLNASAGQPNNRFPKVYLNCPAMVGTMFVINAAENTQMDNIEVNNWSGCKLLALTGGGDAKIGQWRVEVGTYNFPSGSKTVLFDLSNSLSVEFGKLSMGTVAFTATNDNLYLFGLAGVGSFRLASLTLSGNTFTAGAIYGFDADSSTKRAVIEYQDPSCIGNSHYNIVNNGSSVAAEYVQWTQQSKGIVVEADANKQLAVTDAEIHYFPTLTATRNVTLPQADSFYSDVVNGMGFVIVKPASTVGALMVKRFDGTTLETIAAGTIATVEYRYQRSSTNGFKKIR